jgi:hypothetical protein
MLPVADGDTPSLPRFLSGEGGHFCPPVSFPSDGDTPSLPRFLSGEGGHFCPPVSFPSDGDTPSLPRFFLGRAGMLPAAENETASGLFPGPSQSIGVTFSLSFPLARHRTAARRPSQDSFPGRAGIPARRSLSHRTAARRPSQDSFWGGRAFLPAGLFPIGRRHAVPPKILSGEGGHVARRFLSHQTATRRPSQDSFWGGRACCPPLSLPSDGGTPSLPRFLSGEGGHSCPPVPA